MRLIKTSTFQFEEFPDERNVQYAILSHRWEDEEVLFQDWDWTPQNGLVKPRRMKGFYKIDKCCEQARKEGLEYAWVDTCCIDKKSSAELQEAINSMFRWYKGARVCYAYLSDVPTDSESHELLVQSKWFTRGWTLQELVAPKHLMFFSRPWLEIGPRERFTKHLTNITRIPRHILREGFRGLAKDGIIIAQVMNWAKDRHTTRIEDRAYSLLGLFDVFMPMLYGEGERSFRRLQEELLKISGDQSIFAWTGVPPEGGLLAPSPSNFDCILEPCIGRPIARRRFSSVTSEGCTIEVELKPWAPGIHLAVLNVLLGQPSTPPYRCGIYLRGTDADGCFTRVTEANGDLNPNFDPYHNDDDIRVVTVEHPEQSLMFYKEPQDSAPVFTIRLEPEWASSDRPKLSMGGLQPAVISKETQTPIFAGRTDLLAIVDLSAPGLQVGQLRSIAIGIDQDFFIVVVFSSHVASIDNSMSLLFRPFSDSLDDRVPWVPHEQTQFVNPPFIQLPSNDFTILADFSFYPCPFQTKCFRKDAFGFRITQTGGTCSLVVNAGYTGPADFSTSDTLPNGLLCLKFEVGYTTSITLGKRFLSPFS